MKRWVYYLVKKFLFYLKSKFLSFIFRGYELVVVEVQEIYILENMLRDFDILQVRRGIVFEKYCFLFLRMVLIIYCVIKEEKQR